MTIQHQSESESWVVVDIIVWVGLDLIGVVVAFLAWLAVWCWL